MPLKQTEFELRLTFVIAIPDEPVYAALSPSPPTSELHIRLSFVLDTAVSSGVSVKLPEISLKTTPVPGELVFDHGELDDLRLHHVLDVLRIGVDVFGSMDAADAQCKLLML